MKVPPPLKLSPSPSPVEHRNPQAFFFTSSSPGPANVAPGTEAFWRAYPMLAPPRTPNTPGLPSWNVLMEIRNQMPQHLALDPRFWSREDVTSFLQWFQKEFDLPTIDSDKFAMNGKALSLLTKQDVAARAPGAGDILHNALQILLHLNPFRMPLSPFSLMSPPNSAASWTQGAPEHQPIPSAGPSPHAAPVGYHFLSSGNGAASSVTLSPAPSTDSQSSSPKHSGPHGMSSDPPSASSSSSGGQRGESDSDDGHDSSSPVEAKPSATQLLTHWSNASVMAAAVLGDGKPPSNNSSQSQWGNGEARSPAQIPKESFCPKQEHFTTRQDYKVKPEGNEAPGAGGRLLWDFLQQLLNDQDQKYTSFISWKNRETGVFKINDPAGLAHLWGIQKNHLSMNYDKMSRALRYYYRVNILRKVQGERHCYQFLRNPSELRGIKNISLLRNCSPPSRGADMKPDSLTPSASSPALPILRDQHCADSEDTLMAGEETYAPAAAVASSPHPHGSHLAYLHRPTPTNSPSRLPTKQERMDDEDGLTPVEEPTDLSLPSSLRNREASTESPSAWRKTPPVANWKEGTPSPRSHSPYSLPLPP